MYIVVAMIATVIGAAMVTAWVRDHKRREREATVDAARPLARSPTRRSRIRANVAFVEIATVPRNEGYTAARV